MANACIRLTIPRAGSKNFQKGGSTKTIPPVVVEVTRMPIYTNALRKPIYRALLKNSPFK